MITQSGKRLTVSLLYCLLFIILFIAVSPCDGKTQKQVNRKRVKSHNTTDWRISPSTSQFVQQDSRVIARVLSKEPFIIETIEDPTNGTGVFYAPLPISRNIKHSPDEIKQLRYGDIISVNVYSYLYDAGELALGTGIRNIQNLGEQAKSKYDKRGFLIYYARLTNRLSQIKPSASFIEEAVETCKDSCFLYQYKDKLYAFYLSSSCTDGTAGSWACFRATELVFGKIDGQTNWGYIDWPTDVGVRLSKIPKDGFDIPADEYLKHKAFYTRLLSGSRFMYKDGNHIYQGISTRYY